MTELVQQIINGLALGGVYALFATSFTVVFGVFGIFNLAHGSIFMWGSLVGLYLTKTAGLPFAVALVGAMVGAGLLGALLNVLVFDPLVRRGTDLFGFVLASLGISAVLERLAQIATDTKVRAYPNDSLPSGRLTLFSVHVPYTQLIMLGAAIVLGAALFFYLYRTPAGVRARAMAANREVSTLVGIRPARVSNEVFFVSGALAGAAGGLIGAAYNSVSFLMGSPYLLVGIVIIVVGGLGSVAGAMLVGLGLGIVNSLSVGYLPSGWYDVIVWVVLLLVLVVLPAGLLPANGAEVRAVRR
jgi:branched-chain amino acid transport system permease protein